MQTIESKVASAILEKPIGELEIEGVRYTIAPPSIGTLILVSEIVSTLPIVEKVSKEEVTNSVLHNAKYFKALGDIAAVLILGAKGLTEIKIKRRFRYIPFIHTTETIDKKAQLSKAIIENIRPTLFFDIIVRRLQDMEIGSFFAITTSLSEANLLKPTREVGH